MLAVKAVAAAPTLLSAVENLIDRRQGAAAGAKVGFGGGSGVGAGVGAKVGIDGDAGAGAGGSAGSKALGKSVVEINLQFGVGTDSVASS
ncbi:hypothetical protein Ptr902_07367 [Pyrenophora tritici-repentis]|nr:hypothetical protein Ptr902_07367 [Pyrenophora tritici-repentis]